jgi:hypothetical protein
LEPGLINLFIIFAFFSQIQLAFRSVGATIQAKRDQIRRILQLPPPATTTEDKEKTKQEQVS